MRTVKGIYEHGEVKLLNFPLIKQRQEVLVIFPDEVETELRSQNKKELLNYFIRSRKEDKALECSVKELIEEGRT